MIDLGLIPDKFPSEPSVSNSNAMTSSDKAKCGCYNRTKVPEMPSFIPFAPTTDNREKLQRWILEYFQTSAFNTCPHQPLQTMTGKPMDISFKPNITPSAVHTPIPVPHHWKRRVKSNLDRDVELGIIEPAGRHAYYMVLSYDSRSKERRHSKTYGRSSESERRNQT